MQINMTLVGLFKKCEDMMVLQKGMGFVYFRTGKEESDEAGEKMKKKITT